MVETKTFTGSETYHEPVAALSAETIEMHRALASLREELGAIDWYRQRADGCADDNLCGILLHNMREEIEHACMLLEWLRRNDADLAANGQRVGVSDWQRVEQALNDVLGAVGRLDAPGYRGPYTLAL